MNGLLRDQLEQAAHTIQTQKIDLQRMQAECERPQHDLDAREREWANEEKNFR